jgi:hypothetical protein
VRIVDDVDRLRAAMVRAGECPEAVLEATYGWYWVANAHPLGLRRSAIGGRRTTRLLEALDFEIGFTNLAGGQLTRDRGYAAIQRIPSIGPMLGAVFVAEIGDSTPLPWPQPVGLLIQIDPRHHESDAKVHRGQITKQGSRLVHWAAMESVQILPRPAALPPSASSSLVPRRAA